MRKGLYRPHASHEVALASPRAHPLACAPGVMAMRLFRSGPAADAMPAPQPATIANLQLLRAWCALAIILFHTVSTARDYGFRSPLLAAIEGWGFQGVDIFFLISGFVMVLTQERKQRGRSAFLIERLVRIAPIYWLLTGFVFVLTLAVPTLFRSLSANPVWFLQSMSFSTTLFTGGERFPLLYVGWTLEYEMLFYLVFAASLGLASWRSRLLCHFLLFALFWLGFANAILFEFLIGELCALFWLSGRRLPHPRLILAAGLIGLALPMWLWPDNGLVMTRLRFAFFGIPAAGVLLWALHAPPSRNRLLLLLGDASYSIYLIQVLGISFFCKLFARFASETPALVVALASIAGTAALGVLFFRLVERPVTEWIKARIRARELAQATTEIAGP